VCYVAVSLKPFLKYDDSLDAFGVHGVGGFVGAILTGVFASAALVQAGVGNTDPVGKLADGHFAQVSVQALAALVAIVYSFVASLVLVKGIDMTWGFCLDSKSENDGLDRTQHGEVGFDLSLATETSPMAESTEPRAARVPRAPSKRFSVIVDGVKNGELMHVWSDLCRPGTAPPEPEFRAVYPNVTTVQGNRFRFRGGDPQVMRENLQQLFRKRIGAAPVRVHVEN